MRLKRNLIGLIQFSPLATATIIAQTTASGPLSILIVIAALALTTSLIWLLRHHVPATLIHHTPAKVLILDARFSTRATFPSPP